MTDSLVSLLSSPESPPPFVYYHHPHHPSSTALPQLPPHCKVAELDAIEHHTPKLLLSGILYRLGREDEGEIATWDLFARGLRERWDALRGSEAGPSSSLGARESVANGSAPRVGLANGHIESSRKGKGKATENPTPNGFAKRDDEPDKAKQLVQLVVVIQQAERLRFVFGPSWPVLTRMAELTGVPLTIVMASKVPWDEIRPPRGDAPEPLHIFLAAPSKDEVIRTFLPRSKHPLFPHFLDLILTTFLPLLSSPKDELDYLLDPLWSIYTSKLPPHREQHFLTSNETLPNGNGHSDHPPQLDITVRLLTDLKHQMSLPIAAAIEDLVPRQIGRHEFVQAMQTRQGQPARLTGPSRITESDVAGDIPLAGKYLLVSSYCASYNPAKSDLRLFGRGTGPDGKRKKGGGTRRAGYGRLRIGKISQRLLGPKPFPLDRLLAIFASLYVEHAQRPPDLEPRLDYSDEEVDEGDYWPGSVEQAKRRQEKRRERDGEIEEMWEDEVDHLTMSVGLWSLIPQLEDQGLLRRVSPVDRLDNIMLRSEVDYETAKSLARELRITLDEYLYEATA